MRKFLMVSGLTALSLTPLVASAQNVQGVLNTFGSIINILVVLMIGIGILAFFFGLVKYIFSAGEEKHKGLLMIMYALVALFVMVSIWGLIRLLGNTFLPGVSNSPLPAPYQYNPGS